MIDPFCLAAH
jgi:hypothetical protein